MHWKLKPKERDWISLLKYQFFALYVCLIPLWSRKGSPTRKITWKLEQSRVMPITIDTIEPFRQESAVNKWLKSQRKNILINFYFSKRIDLQHRSYHQQAKPSCFNGITKESIFLETPSLYVLLTKFHPSSDPDRLQSINHQVITTLCEASDNHLGTKPHRHAWTEYQSHKKQVRMR